VEPGVVPVVHDAQDAAAGDGEGAAPQLRGGKPCDRTWEAGQSLFFLTVEVKVVDEVALLRVVQHQKRSVDGHRLRSATHRLINSIQNV
jgi:hypothetical protein